MRACINAKALYHAGGDLTRTMPAWSRYCLDNGLASDFLLSLLLRFKLKLPAAVKTLAVELPERDAETLSVYELRCIAAFEEAVTAEKIRLRLAGLPRAEVAFSNPDRL